MYIWSLRDWVERHVAANGDGSYAVAPWLFGRVYIVSEADKEKYVKRRLVSAKISLALAIALFIAVKVLHWPLQAVFLLTAAILVTDGFYAWLLVRDAESVPFRQSAVFAVRFGGSRFRDRLFANAAWFPRWLLIICFGVSALFLAVLFGLLVSSMRKGEGLEIEQSAIFLLFAYLVWVSWDGLRHRRKLAPSPEV